MSKATVTLTEMRVCKKCGEEKPLSEFYRLQRWHYRTCKSCTLKQQTEYHHRHWKEQYQRHQEVRKQRTRDFYYDVLKPRNLELHGGCVTPEQKEQAKRRTAECKLATGYAKTEANRVKGKEHYLLMRTKAITLYGGKCECCGEARYDMLTFDHKVKTYYKDKTRGVALVYEVIREFERSGYPNDKYRLLCWNCNMSRGQHKYCPHEPNHQEREYRGKAMRLEMVAAYGGKCILCGETHWEFLTIDHINGEGTKHRSEVGSGWMFYNYLKKLGWPTDAHRLLCANCNCSRKTNRWAKGVEA